MNFADGRNPKQVSSEPLGFGTLPERGTDSAREVSKAQGLFAFRRPVPASIGVTRLDGRTGKYTGPRHTPRRAAPAYVAGTGSSASGKR